MVREKNSTRVGKVVFFIDNALLLLQPYLYGIKKEYPWHKQAVGA